MRTEAHTPDQLERDEEAATLRAEEMLAAERARADRLLSLLLLAHFPVAVVLSIWHGTWALGIVGGALLSFVPFAVARARPATLLSRLTIAAAFLAYSALFIQESHGMTQMHFHVFVALAFLALYRDWRAPAFGGLLIAVHHAIFHFLQASGAGVWVFDKPYANLYGVENLALHAAFVVFEVAVLILISIRYETEIRTQAAVLSAQERDRNAMRVLAEGLQNRDLTAGLAAGLSAEDEGAIGMLSAGIGHVAELVRTIERTADSVVTASREVAATTAEAGRASQEIAGSLTTMAEGADRQVHAVALVRESVDEVGRAVSLTSVGASQTAEAVERVQEAADQGSAAALEVTSAVNAANERSAAATEAMGELVAKSERISAIVGTIKGIAEQTNLLSLNAAIEAARAGESGRGFAVVAEEVRKLADESQAAAATIAVIVDEIQAEMQRTVSVVEDGVRRSAESVSTVELARAAFDRISAAVQEMTEHSGQIAAATVQISDGADRMRTQMDSIVSVAEEASAATGQASAATEQASASTQEVAASADMLAASAQELQQLVGAFRLRESAA